MLGLRTTLPVSLPPHHFINKSSQRTQHEKSGKGLGSIKILTFGKSEQFLWVSFGFEKLAEQCSQYSWELRWILSFILIIVS